MKNREGLNYYSEKDVLTIVKRCKEDESEELKKAEKAGDKILKITHQIRIGALDDLLWAFDSSNGKDT